MAIQLILLSLLAVGSAVFKDDMQTFEIECLVEGSFQCLSSDCIPPEKYCDGKFDCQDGSDENFCSNHRPDAQFCNVTHQFLCGDGATCIPNSWVCNDEVDCKDGSDEIDCVLPAEHKNSTCKAFQCDGGKRCISNYWLCDGYYDCVDKSDEDVKKTCHKALRPKYLHHTSSCEMYSMNYTCLDKSYCISFSNMCDGLKDCRDGSDEGHFCSNWHTMCTNYTCPKTSVCKPSRGGASCSCDGYSEYNATSRRCEGSRQCELEEPVCSHACLDKDTYFRCICDAGYKTDLAEYLCFAPDPEAMLFFSTKNEIRYIKVKSKFQVTVVTGIKQAHGVAYDGKYLYWVETAAGHQAVMKALLDDVDGTKEVVAALGVRDPGDVSLDHMGGNIYFSDASLGVLVACSHAGPCATLHAKTHAPKFVTLDPREGNMYWADWHDRAVIMKSKMDGSNSEILVDKLSSFATGLSLDAPNGRLYFVDRTIKVVILKDKRVYPFFEEPFHHPYALAVFENTVFWSDWTTNTIQTADKMHGTSVKRNILLSLDMPVFDMHIYHPVLMKTAHKPCSDHTCLICLVTSKDSSVCVCPDTMQMINGQCQYPSGSPQYLLASSGSRVWRVAAGAVAAPAEDTHLDVGRVQAMAFDNLRDTLYIYDGQHKSINSIAMSELSLGVTSLFMFEGIENIVDMDYDYVSDSLYILDAGRRVVEVISLRNKEAALLYRFRDQEIPLSFCVLSAYGRMLVAVLESEQNNAIHINSFGLDGTDRQRLFINNIRGPNIRMRYSPDMDIIYLSDEGNGVIDFLHPQGTGRENFREVHTTIASLAVTDTHVFWTDRRSTRLYWADVHEASRSIRRIELSIFSNNTHLLLLSTSPPPKTHSSHTCSQLTTPCSHICVQKPHEFTVPGSIGSAQSMGYTCLCPIGLINNNGVCSTVMRCKHHEIYCHRSNECFEGSKRCDGVKNCKFGEDEEGCPNPVTENSAICRSDQTNCHGTCIAKTKICRNNTTTPRVECSLESFACVDGSRCVERALACDGRGDCDDASDEAPAACDTRDCYDTEYMCASGSCIPIAWRCDRSEDCADGSDEIGCESSCPSSALECDGLCVEVYRRCDGKDDCRDGRDEADCDFDEFIDTPEQVTCASWEYTCEHNQSLCLPLTARCNGRTDCPGGSDEAGCQFHCSGRFSCAQELWCVALNRVCDGRWDCTDGSDETVGACATVNKTKSLQPLLPLSEFSCKGYRCDSGECVQWEHMCNKTDCPNGSDEKGLCYPPCAGPVLCSHVCHALKDSFLCSCYRGYRLRADRRSCKALRGAAEELYTRGGALRAGGVVLYHGPGGLDDLDYDYRRGKIYLTSSQTGQLIEVNREGGTTADNITNIGMPNKVAVDWITGNVYFVDKKRSNSYMRVCNFDKKKCARLQKLPSDSEVTSLIVDPANQLMFYCLSEASEAHVRSASLSGRTIEDLATVPSCLGLASNSFAKVLYISTQAGIMKVDYDGNHHSSVLEHTINTPHLALFEDYVYFINNSYLIRCLIFGSKTCEIQNHLYNASNFVLSHENIQRDDIINNCYKSSCSNVCVLERVAVCVCHDGALASDGVCPYVNTNELPWFSGVSHEAPRGVSLTFLWVVLLMMVLYACAFVHYRLLKKNKPRSGDYMQVRYHNSQRMTDLSNPIIEISEAGAIGHEFVNPLQFVRNIWRESFERKKTASSSNLVYEAHQDLSDTESDLDIRENRRMIK